MINFRPKGCRFASSCSSEWIASISTGGSQEPQDLSWGSWKKDVTSQSDQWPCIKISLLLILTKRCHNISWPSVVWLLSHFGLCKSDQAGPSNLQQLKAVLCLSPPLTIHKINITNPQNPRFMKPMMRHPSWWNLVGKLEPQSGDFRVSLYNHHCLPRYGSLIPFFNNSQNCLTVTRYVGAVTRCLMLSRVCLRTPRVVERASGGWGMWQYWHLSPLWQPTVAANKTQGWQVPAACGFTGRDPRDSSLSCHGGRNHEKVLKKTFSRDSNIE